MQHEYDQRELDWNTFLNKSKDFDKQEIKWNIFLQNFEEFQLESTNFKMKEILAKEMFIFFQVNMEWIIRDDDKYIFYDECYQSFKKWLETYNELLQNTTKEFVIANFPGVKDISFHSKNNGNQIGTICHMHLEDESLKKIYVKTHQFGPTASMSKSRKLPDAKELVVYKILENIGLGPKCYFFWPNNVSTKTILIGTEGIDLKFYTNETTTTSLEEKMELLKLDLISRILCISDSTTNSGNFGYCEKDNKAYIIDFGIFEHRSYVVKDFMKEFYGENTRYNYKGVMKQVVETSDQEKMKLIVIFFKDCPFEEHVFYAKSFLLNLIGTNTDTVVINSEEVLNGYIEDVIETVKLIKSFLQIQ